MRQAWRNLLVLASLTVSVIAITVSVDCVHASASQHRSPRPASGGAPTSVADRLPSPPPEVRLPMDRRADRLQRLADAIRQEQVKTQLANHQRAEASVSRQIRAERSRLRSLTAFRFPTAGRIGSGFGMRKHPILGYTRLHNGLDIGASCGTPIYAAQSGTVIKAGSSASSGINARIDHGRVKGAKVETAYLHMSRMAVTSGQRIDKGDLVGYVGNTGLSTACHLHFALYENGSGSDPQKYLRRR